MRVDDRQVEEVRTKDEGSCSDAAVVARFAELYYAQRAKTWDGSTTWLGVPALKLPLDLWVMQEIIWETRPELIVETGVARGGSALFYASVLDLVGHGRVIGVDIDLAPVAEQVVEHPRIDLIEGMSTDPDVIRVIAEASAGRRTMVNLDSDHSAGYVRAELDALASMVAPGCYLVVEDTNLNGHPVRPDFGPGPMEAVEEWLEAGRSFEVDESRTKFLATFNPRGYLRRLRPDAGEAAVGAGSKDKKSARPAGFEAPGDAGLGWETLSQSTTASDSAALRYLELLKRALVGLTVPANFRLVPRPKSVLEAAIYDAVRSVNMELVSREPSDEKLYEEGRAWPASGVTMIGLRRLENLEHCINNVLADDIPGDLVETGVWRGGATIFMRALLGVRADPVRRVWVVDSFGGLPQPDTERYPEDASSTHHEQPDLTVSLEAVKENFRRYGLLDDRVMFLQGWFRHTLPELDSERWSLIRLDGDMYESTMLALKHLYPNLAVGGFLIVDDYKSHPACRKAVDDYRALHGMREPIEEIDWTGVFWRKGNG